MMKLFSDFLLLYFSYDQNWKDPRRKRWEIWENFLAERLCLFFGLASNFIKKRLQHRCFPVKFKKFLRTSFYTEHLPTVTASDSAYISKSLSILC